MIQAIQELDIPTSPVNVAIDEIIASLRIVKDLRGVDVYKAVERGLTEWQAAPKPHQVPCIDVVYADSKHLVPGVRQSTNRRKMDISLFLHFYAFAPEGQQAPDLQAMVENISRWTLKYLEYPEPNSSVGFIPSNFWKFDNPQEMSVTFNNVYEKFGVAIEVKRPLYIARVDFRIDVANNYHGSAV
jgi:hypothetical protein